MATIVAVERTSHSQAPISPSLFSSWKPRHGIGVDVAAVEAAQAVDRDRVGPVLLEHGLLGQVHRGRGLQRLARHAVDLRRRLLPAVGDGAGLVLVGRFSRPRSPRRRRHVDDLDAHLALIAGACVGRRRRRRGSSTPSSSPRHSSVGERRPARRACRPGRPALGVRCHADLRPWPRRSRPRLPLVLTSSKHFTAAARSSIRDEATKPTLARLAAEEAGRVDQEPAAAAVLEIGVEHRLARRRRSSAPPGSSSSSGRRGSRRSSADLSSSRIFLAASGPLAIDGDELEARAALLQLAR